MKRLLRTWAQRRRKTWTLVFKLDRPRRVDRVIDYFGERRPAVVVCDRARRRS